MKKSWFNRKPGHKGFKKQRAPLAKARKRRRDQGQEVVPSTEYCDNEFSLLVRLRSKGICANCSRQFDIQELDCSHFHNRRKMAVRFDPENADALCRECHNELEVEKHPGGLYEALMVAKLGDADFEALRQRSMVHISLEVAKAEFLAKLRGGTL